MDTQPSLFSKSPSLGELLSFLPERCSKCSLYASPGGKEGFLQFLSVVQLHLFFSESKVLKERGDNGSGEQSD